MSMLRVSEAYSPKSRFLRLHSCLVPVGLMLTRGSNSTLLKSKFLRLDCKERMLESAGKLFEPVVGILEQRVPPHQAVGPGARSIAPGEADLEAAAIGKEGRGSAKAQAATSAYII